MTEKHGALVRLDFSLLLKILDFDGGIIHRVYTPEEYLIADYCNVVLEHPDLPSVDTRFPLLCVRPIYMVHFAEGGGVIKIERAVPPKNQEAILAEVKIPETATQAKIT